MNTGHLRAPPAGGPSRSRRLRLWLLAGVALAVAAGGAVAADILSGAGTSAPESLLPPAESPPSIAPGDTVAVFLGDSYTQGWGASEPSRRWSALVAAESGWVEVNQGQGGTGFVTTSGPGGCGLDSCPTYLERVPDVIAVQPDIVVIAGGQNDLSAFAAEPDAVRAAVTETYEQIRDGVPEARIIVVGPSLAQPGNPLVADLDEWVRTAATQVGAEYVSLLDPAVIDPTMVAADEVHVNDAGHGAIADRVLAGIRTP